MKRNEKFFGSKRRDNLILLFSMKEVIEEIKKIRSFLKIPIAMYSEDSSSEEKNKLSEKWHEENYKKMDEIEERESHNNELRKIKELLKNNEIDLDEANRRSHEIYSVFPFNFLTQSIEKLIEKYNIPENYKNIIRNYIFFGTIDSVPVLPFTIQYERDLKKKKTVKIDVYEKLTDEDLKELKLHVNKYFGQYLSDFRPIKNIEAKIKAKEYIDNKISRDEYETKDHKMSASEIIENVKADTGIKLKKDGIYGIPKELKRLSEKNFKKKSGK